VLGQVETYEIVKFSDFTSDRRMMSIAVRRIDNGHRQGQIQVFAKGADSAIKSRCSLELIRDNDILDFA
jgi:magnesium-transporting ATPase (P-type)